LTERLEVRIGRDVFLEGGLCGVMYSWKHAIIALALCLAAACGKQSARTDHAIVHSAEGPARLHNGLNEIDLLGDGTPAQVFVAWRGNYNAHGFSVASFYIYAPSDLSDTARVWQVVPFFDGPADGATGRQAFDTGEGADCTLHDIRVIQTAHKPVTAVLADRDLGQSFADSAAVRFEYYDLVRNTSGAVGWPPFYFHHTHTQNAKREYCDVNEAFARELGFGASGLGHGEGGR
jgi:hypothetical protein